MEENAKCVCVLCSIGEKYLLQNRVLYSVGVALTPQHQTEKIKKIRMLK